jgi:putative membrane protein insertion efficiency factor
VQGIAAIVANGLKFLGYILVVVVRFYRLALSRWLPPACRYQPTCSRYAIEALEKHGALRGFYLGVRRVMSCHPWGGHGHDPVP